MNDDRLTEREVRLIANRAGVGEKAIVRLLGSLRITFQKKINIDELIESGGTPAEEELEKAFDIGLRLNNPEAMSRLLAGIGRDELVEKFGEGFREYARNCPLVVAWAGRGDFNPQKRPDKIEFAHVRHATMTAGRIRARLLRLGRDKGYF